MKRRMNDGDAHGQLVGVIRDVRRRWRLKIALRGAAVLAVTCLLGLLTGTLALRLAGGSPAMVLGVRVVIALLALGVTAWLLFLPLARRVTDEQVALYLEEHEPSLGASLLSALAAGGTSAAGVSRGLARKTIETALARCRAVEDGRRIEQRSLKRSSAVLGGAAIMGLLLFAAGPGFVRSGARTLFLPESAAAALRPGALAVMVEPGDTSIARGADLAVTASLAGFRSETVDLLVRPEGDSVFQRIAMLRQPGTVGYQLRLFDLDRAAEYQVEAGAVRSPLYRVKVLAVPYVDKLQVTLNFPAYTGLPPVTMEDGGDIAAPAGSLARVRVTPTMRVPGGRLVLDDGRTVPLTADTAGVLTGEFRVAKSGLYHVELQPPTGKPVNGSPQYLIEVLEDRAPTVSFSRPGRDTRVTSVDEVFLEAKAEDDFGVKGLDLVYSINGAPEKTVKLLDGGALREVTAGHTVYLEELGLKPGDFISYYARAVDVGPGARKPVSSDIYFLEVRPYNRNYRQADEAGGGGGGGGGGGQQQGQDDQLSRRQRELIAATFNVVRDRATTAQADYTANLTSLADAQAKLKEQAETLVQRLTNRGAVRDSAFLAIIASLPLAAAEMEQAVAQLRSLKPGDALPPEQRALLHLQRAEAAYRDVQVSMGQQQGGGGGGGGGGASPEDLSELFGLELDKLRNQYETVQRGEQQQAQGEVENTVDRVKELARRQQQANDQLRAMANQLRNGSGADQQRQLAAETEEQARQLERLSREQSRPDLADAARRLREAADAMRRAAANGRTGNAADSRAALDRLREAARGLDGSRAAGVQQQADDAARRAQRLAEEQRQIARQMEELSSAGANRDERARRLMQQKEEQAREVADLERQLDQLAAQSRQQQPDASRRAQAAAESIRRNQLQETIQASRAGTQAGAPRDYVRAMEQQIGEGLDELSRRTSDTRQAMSAQTGESGNSRSLDRARDLARSLESLAERTRQAGDDPRQDGQNARGQQDRPGQQGQAQQGQQAQGQQGQQGQGQQGQGQQARGQQGQGQQGQQARGQQGQRGGTQQGGQQANGGRMGGPGARAGVAGWGERGPLDYDDIRQLRGEAAQRLAEARELRRELAAEGQDVRELDRAIADLSRLSGQGPYASWDELQKLQSSVVDRVKQIEFSLRRKAGEEESRKLFLAGSGEVPEGYRALVEEYYRELSDRPGR